MSEQFWRKELRLDYRASLTGIPQKFEKVVAMIE